MRSKLFVPATRPEFFSKAFAGDADAISIDLEDAVVEARKSEARQAVEHFLKDPQRAHTGKTLILRVNAMDTPHFRDDIAAVVRPGLDVVNLPKPDSPEAVREAVALIEKAEHANAVTTPVSLLLNIETPRALREAAALASSHPRVTGLQLGLGDLFEPLGIDRRDTAAVHQVMLMVRLAAGEAGIQAYDGAFADVSSKEALVAEAGMARRLGFAGKTCIHPSQVALVNQVFRPDDAEIAHALKVLKATEKADSEGTGAYMVDGKMIDAPFLRRARAIVAIALHLGLLPQE